MKITHLNRNFISHSTGQELWELAKAHEKEGDRESAVSVYRAMIRKNYQREHGYQRLMILYRNLKEYQLELEVIDEALTEFRKIYSTRREIANKTVALTSKKLMKLMGIKNDDTDFPQPVPKWSRRKELLQKLVNKNKSKK